MSDVGKEKFKKDHREAILARYETGWMPKAGRCKKLTYLSKTAGEVRLDGTWELETAKYLDKMGLTWRRNKERFPYQHPLGYIAHYTPDFYVENWNSYLEVKGFETDLDRCKWSQFRFNLIVWKKLEIFQIKKELQPEIKFRVNGV